MTNTTLYGVETPRVYTQLETGYTRGNDFIAFCENVLNITLFPWQKWLARHALMTWENGEYVFDVILVIVARQNGKSMFASALASWWLACDILREKSRAQDGRVLGVAQNLAIAEKPWGQVADWFDCQEKNALKIPQLAELTEHVFRGNGNKTVKLKKGLTYSARDGANSRGESASRVLLDEVREQTNFKAWDAVSEVTKTYRDGQIFAITSGAHASSVVQNLIYEQALRELNDENATIGLFEWSAPEACALDDVDAVLQANPSIGYLPALTPEKIMRGARTHTEASYRCESLCQKSLGIQDNALFSRATIDALQAPQPAKSEIINTVAVSFVTDRRAYSGALAVHQLSGGGYFVGMLDDVRAGTRYGDTLLSQLSSDIAKVKATSQYDPALLYDCVTNGTLKLLDGSTFLCEGLALTRADFLNESIKIREENGVYGAVSCGLAYFMEKELDTAPAMVSAYEARGVLAV